MRSSRPDGHPLMVHSASEVPLVNRFPRGDFAAADRELTGGGWTLHQAWRASPQRGLRRGTVRFGWTPEALWVLAHLPDDHVESRSTEHNQPMWELGDVFEIFVARHRSPLYLELHTTPNNHRLHLCWTGREVSLVRTKQRPLEDFVQDPPIFQSWIRGAAPDQEWSLLVRLPASLWPDGLAFRAGQQLRLSFSRYDSGPGGKPQILSSTSPHRELDYHRRREWRTVTLAPGTGRNRTSRSRE